MFLIVGLGNPGQEYKKTRHNIGFRVIDEMAKENDFPAFTLSKKHNALVAENILNGEKIILAKPQTFMNNSGKAVRSLIGNWKLEIGNLIVVHDDIDIMFGQVKISKNKNSAGHKGVESIINELKTKDFIRFRVGIESRKIENKEQKTEKFVLQKFTKEEEGTLEKIVKKTAMAIILSAKEGIKKQASKK